MATSAKHLGRWHVASRVFAAVIPAFVLTNTASIFLGLLIPGDKFSGVATATLLSYAIYTALIMWIFSVERLRTVWIVLLSGILATGAGSWLLYTLEATA